MRTTPHNPGCPHPTPSPSALLNRGSGSSKPAFTLLELVLAVLLITLLVGMVFATARASLQIGNTVVKTQNEEMLQQAFFELLNNRLAALPGNTLLDLKITQNSPPYLTDLTLQNVPMSFTWGGTERTAKAIQLSTVLRRSGFIDLVLRYYENEIIGQENVSAIPEAPFAEIILLTDLAYFEWQALDGRTMDLLYEWDLPGRLPLQLELVCSFGANSPEIRHVFWLPPRQNPAVFMRQLLQGNQQLPEGGTNGPPDEINVEIPSNPQLPPGTRRPPGNQLPPGARPPNGDQLPPGITPEMIE